MLNSTTIQSTKTQVSIGRLMILIAILATYSALYTVMRNRNAAYPWAAPIMTVLLVPSVIDEIETSNSPTMTPFSVAPQTS